jgi:hypothetical protein
MQRLRYYHARIRKWCGTKYPNHSKMIRFQKMLVRFTGNLQWHPHLYTHVASPHEDFIHAYIFPRASGASLISKYRYFQIATDMKMRYKVLLFDTNSIVSFSIKFGSMGEILKRSIPSTCQSLNNSKKSMFVFFYFKFPFTVIADITPVRAPVSIMPCFNFSCIFQYVFLTRPSEFLSPAESCNTYTYNRNHLNFQERAFYRL